MPYLMPLLRSSRKKLSTAGIPLSGTINFRTIFKLCSLSIVFVRYLAEIFGSEILARLVLFKLKAVFTKSISLTRTQERLCLRNTHIF